MKEERFEKVVEWKDRNEDVYYSGVSFGGLSILSILSFMMKFDELGFVCWILIIVLSIVCFITGMGKRKVYWRKKNENR